LTPSTSGTAKGRKSAKLVGRKDEAGFERKTSLNGLIDGDCARHNKKRESHDRYRGKKSHCKQKAISAGHVHWSPNV